MSETDQQSAADRGSGLSDGLGLSRMEQLIAFCDWERKHRPHPEEKVHIAEWAASEIERVHGLYEELLLAVGNKHPGETRHQTALRYIRQAEATRISAAQCEGPNVRGNAHLTAAQEVEDEPT